MCSKLALILQMHINMSIYDKKYQIFVSSTYHDLIKAREEVIKVILNLYQIPIGMEMFSADNDEQWSVIQSTIDNCDYYLLIVGHRYGSLTRENISYTEKEFDYAKSIGVPIISFVKNRDVATKPKERDTDSSKELLLNVFLDKVLKNSLCDFWNNENELGQKVAISLTKMFLKTPRIGWVKANQSNFLETTEEIKKIIQENRELRDVLTKIESQKQNDIPLIEVRINKSTDINLLLLPRNFSKYAKITPQQILPEYEKFVTPEDIEYYNNEIDKKQAKIDKYIYSITYFENVKYNHTKIAVEVSNNGNSKATDIFIDISFPEQVVLFDLADYQSYIRRPEPPIDIENPINRAQRLTRKPGEEYNSLEFIGSGLDMLPLVNSKTSNVNRPFWINKEKNTLTIKLSKIMHTRSVIIADYIFIAPLKKGIYEYMINTICNEYASNKELKHKLIIK